MLVLDLLHREAEARGDLLRRVAGQLGEGHGVAVRLPHDLGNRRRRAPDGRQVARSTSRSRAITSSAAAFTRTRSVTPAAARSSRRR